MNSTRMRGKKGKQHTDPADPPRCRGNKHKGQGTWQVDRPPIFGLLCRHSGEVRYFVRAHADGPTCREVVTACVPKGARLYTDGLTGYVAVGAALCSVHGQVLHSQ